MGRYLRTELRGRSTKPSMMLSSKCFSRSTRDSQSWRYEVSGSARRSTKRCAVELVAGDDVFDLYGRWNALAAFDRHGKLLGATRAHDGDFFPESILDYSEALRAAVTGECPGQYSDIFPLRVDIDITQACNANCTFCFSRPYQREEYRGRWGGSA